MTIEDLDCASNLDHPRALRSGPVSLWANVLDTLGVDPGSASAFNYSVSLQYPLEAVGPHEIHATPDHLDYVRLLEI